MFSYTLDIVALATSLPRRAIIAFAYSMVVWLGTRVGPRRVPHPSTPEKLSPSRQAIRGSVG
jgi:hypothetical protein